MTRTLLFDVDQTLLYTGGAGSLAMARAFHQLYGIDDAFQAIEGSGRTDWNILKRGLELHDLLDGTPIEELLPSFIDVYLEHLPATLREAPGGHVKPGVPELLDALATRDDVRLGLATGNFKRACLLKLAHYKLDAHLSDGGFGEDAEDRGDMVTKAIQRVSNGSRPNQIWIVGDTPRDVEAARANNVRCLAVATGDSTVDELRAAGADVVQIDDPYMQARPQKAREYAVKALNRALEGVTGTTAVHVCFGYAHVVHERGHAGDTDRHVGVALAPGPAEGVAHNHGDVGAGGLADGVADAAAGGVGVLRQQADRALGANV